MKSSATKVFKSSLQSAKSRSLQLTGCGLCEAIPSWRVFVFGGSADRMGRAPEPVESPLRLAGCHEVLMFRGEGRTMGSFDRKLGGYF